MDERVVVGGHRRVKQKEKKCVYGRRDVCVDRVIGSARIDRKFGIVGEDRRP